MKKDDSYIWDQLKTGEKRAFELLFKNHYLQLCLFSKQFTGNLDESREVVQDLFVWLWEKRAELENLQSVKAYIHSALRFNSIRRAKSTHYKFVDIPEIPEEKFVSDYHDELEHAELQTEIYQTIEKLPVQCQKIFKLSRFEKLTYKEIAEQLNISVKTVEAQMSKALKKLQANIDKYLITIVSLVCFCLHFI